MLLFSSTTAVLLLTLPFPTLGLWSSLWSSLPSLPPVSLPPPSSSQAAALLGDSPTVTESVDWEIAHRCGGLDAPENSVEAVRLAAEHGAKWVELDISFSKDGVAVAFHDSSMERLTSLTGDITSFPYRQLAGEDLALKHNSSTPGPVAIPRVEQVLEEAARHGLKVILDLKTWRSPGQTVELVLQLYRDFPWLETRGMVTTFYPHLTYLLRRRQPTIVTAVSVHRRWPQVLELGLWRLLGFSAVLASKELVTEQLRDFWLERGVRLMAWTVNDEQEKRSMKEMRIQILTDTVTVT